MPKIYWFYCYKITLMALAYVTALCIQDTLLIRQTCGSGLSGWFSSVCSYVTIGGHKTVDYVVFCLITAYAFCSSCTILLGFCCFQHVLYLLFCVSLTSCSWLSSQHITHCISGLIVIIFCWGHISPLCVSYVVEHVLLYISRVDSDWWPFWIMQNFKFYVM